MKSFVYSNEVLTYHILHRHANYPLTFAKPLSYEKLINLCKNYNKRLQ